MTQLAEQAQPPRYRLPTPPLRQTVCRNAFGLQDGLTQAAEGEPIPGQPGLGRTGDLRWIARAGSGGPGPTSTRRRPGTTSGWYIAGSDKTTSRRGPECD